MVDKDTTSSRVFVPPGLSMLQQWICWGQGFINGQLSSSRGVIGVGGRQGAARAGPPNVWVC